MAPKQPDWKPSFKRTDKIPFGSYIMFDILKDVFPGNKIEENDKSLFLKFNDNKINNSSLIIITDNFNPGHASLSALLEFVEKGNKAFIVAESFEKEFRDTLHFNSTMFFNDRIMGDSIPYNFNNPFLKSSSPYWIKSAWTFYYFNSVDTAKSKKIAFADKNKLNFFRLPYGKGEFLLHNQPYAFTNYNLLFKNNAEYVFKTFSYLKNKNIIWDENYKPGRNTSTPLIYILEQNSLKYAWYLLLFFAFIFMIFGAKRKQRIIPVIAPPENSSLEFAKTLGNLYLSNKNHKDIARKKYNYWLDFLREKYFIHIENPEDADIIRISEKTGVNVESIIKTKKYIDKASNISQEHLMRFNQLIEDFHKFRK
jgi:hypothetical protein